MNSTPLHSIGNALRDLLTQIPLPVVRLLFLAFIGSILAWVLCLPRAETVAPNGKRGGANLKVGAAIALILQLVIYSLL